MLCVRGGGYDVTSRDYDVMPGAKLTGTGRTNNMYLYTLRDRDDRPTSHMGLNPNILQISGYLGT